jgi:hypothetical protein
VVSKPDDNWISFTGDRAGNVWRNGEHIFGPDVPEHDVPRSERVVVLYEKDFIVPAGRKIADMLKFSGVRGLTVIVKCVLPGGYEDCADFNNGCWDVIVRAWGYVANGKYVATIKGRSRNITMRGMILRGGRVADVGLGNWSDQSSGRTEDIVLDLPREDGKPTTYYRMNATTPIPGTGVRLKRCFHVPGELRRIWVNLHGLLKKLGLPV